MLFFLLSISSFSYNLCICNYVCSSTCESAASNNYLVTDFISDLNLKLRSKFESVEDEEINLYLYSSKVGAHYSFDLRTFTSNAKVNFIKTADSQSLHIELWTEANTLEDDNISSATFVLDSSFIASLPITHGSDIHFSKISLGDPSSVSVFYEEQSTTLPVIKDQLSLVAHQIIIPESTTQEIVDKYPRFLLDIPDGNGLDISSPISSIQLENALIKIEYDNKQIQFGSYFPSVYPFATLNCNHSDVQVNSVNTNSYIPSVVLMDPQSVNFVGEFPQNGSFYIDGTSTFSIQLTTSSNIMPVSIVSENVEMATLTFTSFPSIITGIITRPVIIDFNSQLTERSTLTFLGEFNSPHVDIGSSYLDVIINYFNPSAVAPQMQIKSDESVTSPFTFRTGRGGVSTIVIRQTNSSELEWNNIVVYPETDEYIKDSELSALLNKGNWVIIGSPVPFSTSSMTISMQSEKFIHGFTQNDECMVTSISNEGLVARFTPPSELPLNVCYDKQTSQCQEGDGFYVESMSEIPEKYFIPDFKKLNINIKSTDDNLSIDTTFINSSYSEVELSIQPAPSFEGDRLTVKSFEFPSENVFSISFTNLVLPSFSALGPEFIFFTNCSAQNSDVRFTISEDANLVFDNEEEEKLMSSHITHPGDDSETSTPTTEIDVPTSEVTEPVTSEPTSEVTEPVTSEPTESIDSNEDDEKNKKSNSAVIIGISIAVVVVVIAIIVGIVIVKKRKNLLDSKKEDSLNASLINW